MYVLMLSSKKGLTRMPMNLATKRTRAVKF